MTRPLERRRLGLPLRLTAEQLDQAAEVTPFDEMGARSLWEQAAPQSLKDLLDAAEVTDAAQGS